MRFGLLGGTFGVVGGFGRAQKLPGSVSGEGDKSKRVRNTIRAARVSLTMSSHAHKGHNVRLGFGGYTMGL